MPAQRFATHTATKVGATTSHFATARGVSACNGRTMGMAFTAPVTEAVTCRSCRQAVAAGRVLLVEA